MGVSGRAGVSTRHCGRNYKILPTNEKALIKKNFFLPILIIVAVGAAAMYWDLLVPRKDFYNELWAPTYLLLRGQSPYVTAPLHAELPAAWLPMAIGFFAPLGALSESVAQRVWFLFNIVELAVVVYLARSKDSVLSNLIVVCLLVFLFPSTIHHLILGQFSLTTTLCVVIGALFVIKGKHWLGAFLLSLGLSKIHLTTLPMLGLSIFYFQQSGAKGMFAFWGRVAIASLALTLPLFIAYPNWIPDAIKSMASNTAWTFPTLQNFFIHSFGAFGMALWVVAVLLVVSISIFLSLRLNLVPATYWNLGLALLVSPYIGSWDFVVLLPLITYSFLQARKWQKAFMLVSYLAAWGLMVRIQLLTGNHNYFFWWVPLWHLVTAALIFRWRNSTTLTLPAESPR